MKHSAVFFGTPQLSVPALESLTRQFEVIGVISQPDKPAGKGGRVSPSPVSRFALDHGLTLYRPAKLIDQTFKEWFCSLKVDVAVVLAYGKILPQWVLDQPKQGAINIHASLLPYHRGASPIAASILADDDETGISYMVMNSRMDEGDVLFQTRFPIESVDTSASMSIKISQSASIDINKILADYLVGDLHPAPQDHTRATYSQILTKDDGQIDFDQPPPNLERMVRAYYPWPGVWGLFRNKRVKVLPEGRVQMEGKKIATLAEFRNGYPDFPLPAGSF